MSLFESGSARPMVTLSNYRVARTGFAGRSPTRWANKVLDRS